MRYQKIINLLDDTMNQPSKFGTRNWVEINDESKERYGNSNIRFKKSMIRSNLCDYCDSYILARGTITVPNTAAAGAAVNNTHKKIFINCAPFTDCKTEINNTQVDDGQKIDVVMPMYNLIGYSDPIWRHGPALENNGNITDFPDDSNNSASFKFKLKITGQTGNSGTKYVEIMVPLKHVSNFWRTLGMPLIKCEISLQLKWSRKCVIFAGTANNQNPTFQIIDTKLYALVFLCWKVEVY